MRYFPKRLRPRQSLKSPFSANTCRFSLDRKGIVKASYDIYPSVVECHHHHHVPPSIMFLSGSIRAQNGRSHRQIQRTKFEHTATSSFSSPEMWIRLRPNSTRKREATNFRAETRTEKFGFFFLFFLVCLFVCFSPSSLQLHIQPVSSSKVI